MPHTVDVHVGQRMRRRRLALGMTMQLIADRIGVKFQQIQKYESGANRVSASRLWEIAAVLDVPVSYFFHGLTEDGSPKDWELPDIFDDRETLELLFAYHSIPDTQRRHLFDLARALGSARPSAVNHAAHHAA